jgi:methylmalonyl-CoA mutase
MADSGKSKGGMKAAEHLAEWQAVAEKELRGKPLEGLVWKSPEGLPIKPLYTAADLEGLEQVDTLPGVFPFLRGRRLSL